MPELAMEVRLVVVRLQVSPPLTGLLNTQPAIAVLEPDDARELLRRHPHAREESPLERARINGMIASPGHDRLGAVCGANPLQQARNRRLLGHFICQSSQEEP